MDVLRHLAEAAAVILLIELLVVVLIFAAVAGGVGFGLHWVRGKGEQYFPKVNEYVATGRKYVHQGTDYAAKPVIVAGGFGATVRETLDSIRRRVRNIRETRSAPVPVAARPVPPPESEHTETVEPLV